MLPHLTGEKIEAHGGSVPCSSYMFREWQSRDSEQSPSEATTRDSALTVRLVDLQQQERKPFLPARPVGAVGQGALHGSSNRLERKMIAPHGQPAAMVTRGRACCSCCGQKGEGDYSHPGGRLAKNQVGVCRVLLFAFGSILSWEKWLFSSGWINLLEKIYILSKYSVSA